MTKDLDHCLYHCEGFMSEAVDKRTEMAKKGGYCPVCLYPGHNAATCKNADSSRYVCGVKGCDKHHHPILHGSKDKYVTSVNVVKAMEYSEAGVTSRDVDFSSVNTARMYEVYGEKEVDERAREMMEARKKLAEPPVDGDKVLLVIQETIMVCRLGSVKVDVVTFFDDGSTCSVVLNSFAEKNNLYR